MILDLPQLSERFHVARIQTYLFPFRDAMYIYIYIYIHGSFQAYTEYTNGTQDKPNLKLFQIKVKNSRILTIKTYFSDPHPYISQISYRMRM